MVDETAWIWTLWWLEELGSGQNYHSRYMDTFPSTTCCGAWAPPIRDRTVHAGDHVFGSGDGKKPREEL